MTPPRCYLSQTAVASTDLTPVATPDLTPVASTVASLQTVASRAYVGLERVVAAAAAICDSVSHLSDDRSCLRQSVFQGGSIAHGWDLPDCAQKFDLVTGACRGNL